ncbi:MAG TPA: hypothetical protein VG755_33560 [Nannocystaceae bacterium]|nr:hypothetical protein [Nannocystaceae bacterium]
MTHIRHRQTLASRTASWACCIALATPLACDAGEERRAEAARPEVEAKAEAEGARADEVDALAKAKREEPKEEPSAANPDIRAKGYTGFDAKGDALPLTPEEVRIAVELGNALFHAAGAGADEEKVVRRIAKKHRISAELLDGIWGRANVLQDRRVLSAIGK